MPHLPLAPALTVDIDGPLGALMTRPVVTANPTISLREVRALFERLAIHHLPIVGADGAPVGIVSANDLDRAGRWGVHGEREATARDVMSDPVQTLTTEHSLHEAAALLNRHRFHCLPVVDERGRVAGILTAHDLIRLAYPGS